MQELFIGLSSDAGCLSGRARLKRQLHLQEIPDQVLMSEAVTDAYAGQTINLGKRAQSNHVVIAIMHGVRVSRIVLGVFKVRFVQNNEDALRYVPVKLVELLFRKDGSGWIIRIRQIDNLGPVVDLASESL